MTIKSLLTLGLSLSSLCAHAVELKATKLSLFKSGYGYISLEGTLDDSPTPQLSPIPIPIQGGFWISAEPGVDINQVVSKMIKRKQPLTPDNANLLAANAGKKVTLRFSSSNDDDVRELTGTIIPLPKTTKQQNHHTISPQNVRSNDPDRHYSTCLLQTPEGVRSISIGNIDEILFHEAFEFASETVSAPGVILHLKAPAAGKKIHVNCLSEELSWLPSYRLELRPDGQALLEAKATILNSVMNLDRVQLELVSGTPAPIDTKLIDPMALVPIDKRVALYGKQGILITENRITTPMLERRYVNSNVIQPNYYQGAGSWSVAQGGDQGEVSVTPKIGTDTGALFYYPVADFSMKAGEVVTKPLFSASVAYKKIYTWTLGEPTEFERNTEKKVPEDLWNCVRFTNPLNMPLTAAPVEVMDSQRFAAMNTLQYTGKQSVCTIKMSRGLGVEVEKKTTITDTKRISMGFKSRALEANTTVVRLSMQNKTAEPIEMDVTQHVTGEILSVNQGGSTTSRPSTNNYNNKITNTIKWTVTIPAHGKQELSYTYKYIN